MGQGGSRAVLQENTIVSKTKQLNITEEDLVKLQHRVCEEYPFIANVYESVVVTDITLPDNPIVFCNDNFQRMTLYSREEIIGKNCRFLQGQYTSKAATTKIRNAILAGKELDVQLLNYRKDGTPFWNNFLLLPVHRKKGSKKVTHFIAIQKDVTVLKQGQKNPSKWGPKEVSLFVTYLEPVQSHEPAEGEKNIVDLIIEKRINGDRFLTAKKEDWQRWGVANKEMRKSLLSAAKNLKEDRRKAVKVLLKEEKSEDNSPSENESSEKEETVVDMDFAGPHKSPVDVSQPRQLKFWTQQPSFNVTCVKFYYKKNVDIRNYSKNLTYDQLVGHAAELYPALQERKKKKKSKEIVVKAKASDGEMTVIANNEDFQRIKELYGGRTLNLYIS